MITIISTKTRNQILQLTKTSIAVIAILISATIPAIIFKIILEQTRWWVTPNGIHVLNASTEKRILYLMSWSVILLFAWIIIQIIIADIYNNVIPYHNKHSLSQPKIKQFISAFNLRIIMYSFLFSILYTILGTILSPHQVAYLILTFILFGIDWLVNNITLP